MNMDKLVDLLASELDQGTFQSVDEERAFVAGYTVAAKVHEAFCWGMADALDGVQARSPDERRQEYLNGYRLGCGRREVFQERKREQARQDWAARACHNEEHYECRMGISSCR